MIFERTQCPICSGTRLLPLVTLDATRYAAHDPAFPAEKAWLQCASCTHVFSQTAWTRETFAESLSRPVHGADKGWDDERYADAYDTVRGLVSRVASETPSLAELGCGKCYMAGVAVDMGITATAVDPHPTFRHYAERVGCNFVQGFFEDLDLPAHDIVTLGDVLEHCTSPHEAIARLPLAEHGVLYVATPRCDLAFYRVTEWMGMYYVSDHMHFFTGKSLLRLMGEHGYTLVDHRISRAYRGCVEWVLTR